MKTARKARIHWGIDRQDIGRFLRSGLLILAIALQGYITQVHHHDFAEATLAAASGGNSTSDSPVSPVDSDGRDHHCFICHLSSLGATSVAPPSIPLTTAPIGPVVYRVDHDSRISRDAPAAYLSRAPPSLVVPA